MLAEAQRVNCIDDCNKMQTLSSNQLPDLIKSFELKINQKKDVTQVKRPAAKMRLRDPAVVFEIARLRVLVSEMREKTMKMEAQLKLVSEKSGKERKNSLDAPKGDVKNEEITTIDVRKASMLAADKTPDKVETITPACDINLVTTSESPLKCNGENGQDIFKNANIKFLLEQRLRLDTVAIELQAHIESLHREVHGMLLELATRPDLQEELAIAKERMKELQEEIKDDASTTKAQLLLLRQQFGELETLKNASEQKELEFQKASHVSSALEAEVAELKIENQEILKQKQDLCKKLQTTIEKAEKIKPLTKDDVLASEAEVSNLRSTNVELQKKVESLQISRFNEVEEVVYLRWVNACLRHDLDVYESSHSNFEDISNQIENCSAVSGGRYDPMVRTSSGRPSASYNNAHDYCAPHNDSENMHEQCECGMMSSPQLSKHVNSAHSSPASIRHGRMNINISPLAIPQGLVSSRHSSPLVSPIGHRDGSNSSSLASPQGYVDGSNSSLRNAYGRLKSMHISPQKSPSGEVKRKSGARHSTHQHSPSDIRLSQSPDACNPHHYSLGRMQLERDPQNVANIQSMLSFNGDQTAKLDATSTCTKTRTQNFPSRSGRSFDRWASTVSASSEGSKNQTQDSPQMQDRRTYMRSSSTLSADSENNIKSKTILRRHSASSGMSLLDDYLHSTDPRSPNRPTSRFSAVLPHDRHLSKSKTVPFATMEEVTVPLKREDFTAVKAYPFESHEDASDKVVAAFQRLSSSTPTRSSHRAFKDLSRRNSHDGKAYSNVMQEPDKHDAPMSSTRSTQADFICDLARAVQVACYNSIEQVSAFVNWFDRQGEVEKQEFFKFPDCPRDKVEAMRRAVYEYEELRALETDLSSYKDMLVEGPADFSLQDVKSLLEKVEDYIEGFKQARGLAIAQFKELDIPTYWMLDSGMIAKIKQAALQLAGRYIKQVTNKLTTREESGEVGVSSLVEAAGFLLQLHNFVGGFDERTANAFKILQSQVHL